MVGYTRQATETAKFAAAISVLCAFWAISYKLSNAGAMWLNRTGLCCAATYIYLTDCHFKSYKVFPKMTKQIGRLESRPNWSRPVGRKPAPQSTIGKLREPWLGWRLEIIILAAPGEAQAPGVQSVVGQDEPLALLIGQPALNQSEVQVGIAAIYLIAHNGMAQMGEVQTDLVFTAGAGQQPQKREWKMEDGGCPADFALKPFFHNKLGLGGGTIGTDAVFDGDDAVFVPAERGIDDA